MIEGLACRICGGIEIVTPDKTIAGFQTYVVQCDSCRAHRLTSNPALQPLDTSIPKEPRMRVRP